MSALLTQICPLFVLLNAQPDPLAGLLEAYTQLLHSPEVRVVDLQAAQESGNAFLLAPVASSEGIVIRNAFQLLEAYVARRFADSGAVKRTLSNALAKELERRSVATSSFQRANAGVAVDARVERERWVLTRGGNHFVFFTPDGAAVVGVSQHERSLTRYDLRGAPTRTLEHYLPVNADFTFGYAPGGRELYVKASREQPVQALDLVKFQWGPELDVRARPGNVSLSRDGAWLASPNVEGWTVYRMSAAGPREAAHVKVTGTQHVSPDGQYLVSVDSPQGKVTFVDRLGKAFTFEVSELRSNAEFTTHLAFRGRDTEFATGNTLHADLAAWDGARQQRLRTYEGRPAQGVGGYNAIDYSPDGRWLVAVEARHLPHVLVWDAQTGERLGDWMVGSEYAHALAFSPNGQVLATVSRHDSGIRIWNLAERLERP